VTTPITFSAVAEMLALRGWRPFPGRQSSKIPAMRGWPGLNAAPWDADDLAAAVVDYQPEVDFCCCMAVQPEVVAVDLDIVDPVQAAFAAKCADEILGATPLERVGLSPKSVRIYRNGGDIESRKLHPVELFAGSGQIVGFGWHAKADRPYHWPIASPLELDVDSDEIPLVANHQVDRFLAKIFDVVPRRQTIKGCRPSAMTFHTIGDRLRHLTFARGDWKRAAALVLSEAEEGNRNDTSWTVVASGVARGFSDDEIIDLFEQHYAGWDGFSASDLTSALERARRNPAVTPPLKLIFPAKFGGDDGAR
jgi:hypothetical protein